MKRCAYRAILPLLCLALLCFEAPADEGASNARPAATPVQEIKNDLRESGAAVKATARKVKEAVKEAARETKQSTRKAFRETREAVKEALQRP